MAEREVQQLKEREKMPQQTASQGAANVVNQNTNPKKDPKHVANPKNTKVPPKEVNNEVLLILKELNSKFNAQSTRIEKQDERIEDICRKLESQTSYDDDSYYYVDGEYYDENSQEISPIDLEAGSSVGDSHSQHSEPPNKRQKTDDQASIFKTLSEKFQQNDSVDNEVNDDLANFVNTSFRNGISDEKQADLMKDVHRPKNCEGLVKTRVNQGIWRLLKTNTQTEDAKLQHVQNLMVKATSNLVKVLDKNSESFDSQDLEWGTNAVALLGQANKLLNTRRKDMHKADLDPKYYYLTSPTLPFTELLYGEDVDVNKNVREINDMNRLGRNLGRNQNYNARGNFRGRRPQYRRGNFRPYGRGRAPPRMDASYNGSAKNSNRATYKK